MSVSKIEIALDTNKDFVFESMKLALKHRAGFVKMKSPKFIFNFTNKTYESLSVENTINILKVYSKSEELKLTTKNSAAALYGTATFLFLTTPPPRCYVEVVRNRWGTRAAAE